MDFGWAAQAFWIVAIGGVLTAVWYSKRNPPPPVE